MRANVAQDEEPNDHVFATVASFSITDAAESGNPSKRIETYDSGATCHMSPYTDAFTDFEFITPKPISAANNQTFKAIGKGNLRVKIPNGENFTTLTLRDVLYAPSVAFTLISLSRVDKVGYTTVIADGELHLIGRSDNTIIGRAPTRNGLWSVRHNHQTYESDKALISGSHSLTTTSLIDLHRCLGHISPSTIAELVNKGALTGVTIQ